MKNLYKWDDRDTHNTCYHTSSRKKLSMFNLLKIKQKLCICRVSCELNFLKVKSLAKGKII